MVNGLLGTARRSEPFKMGAAILAVFLLGGGVAAAAIGMAPKSALRQTAMSLSLPTLTAGRGLRVAPAYGADDEDCIFARRAAGLRSGQMNAGRELICRE